jgi:GH43 family beta-xylosidase
LQQLYDMALRCLVIAVSGVAAIEWGSNPIIDDQVDLADPSVVEFDGKLYAYPTSNQAQYEVYVRNISSESPGWTKGGAVFDGGMICPYSWVPGVGNHSLTWAPHVMHDEPSGKFYLYYTVCMTVGVAVSDSPMGPFQKVRDLVHLAIDAYTMRDDDGQLYLYYAKMWNLDGMLSKDHYAESVYGRRLKSPTELASDPAVELIRPDQQWWEFNSSNGLGPFARFLVGINEGPWVLKHKDTYYMTYSGAAANSEFYRLGFATSDSPLGPFTKGDESSNPIIRPRNPSTIGVYGPGHHSVWRDSSTGRYWAIYHRQKTNGTGWGRELCVDELVFDDATGDVTLAVTPSDRSTRALLVV